MKLKTYVLIFVSIVLAHSLSVSAKSKKNHDKKELKVGMNAPNFTLQDVYGHSYTLSKFRGKKPVIVYFYPKAGTPGCTKEACGIRDDWGKFQKSKIQVLGISVDTKPEIKKFINDYHLNFPLLSDATHKVSNEYGVYGIHGYDNRITFIVNKDGKIADIIKVKNIDAHAEEVYKLASNLL